MEEIWKDIDIEGFEDKYKISNTGKILNIITGKELKQSTVKNGGDRGRKVVTLLKNGKQKHIAIHRLVAMYFIPQPEDKNVVHHLDGNKSNNNVSNLIWVDEKEHGKIRDEEYYKKWNETRIKNKKAREKKFKKY